MRDPQLTLFARAGKRARDAALDTVEGHSLVWSDEAIKALRRFALVNTRFTAPAFALVFQLKPHHPNAWGAFWRRAKREGIVEESHEPFVTSCGVSAHARRVPVYRSLIAHA